MKAITQSGGCSRPADVIWIEMMLNACGRSRWQIPKRQLKQRTMSARMRALAIAILLWSVLSFAAYADEPIFFQRIGEITSAQGVFGKFAWNASSTSVAFSEIATGRIGVAEVASGTSQTLPGFSIVGVRAIAWGGGDDLIAAGNAAQMIVYKRSTSAPAHQPGKGHLGCHLQVTMHCATISLAMRCRKLTSRHHTERPQGWDNRHEVHHPHL